jgi:hypothetical protein
MTGIKMKGFSKTDLALFLFVFLVLLCLFWVLPPLGLSSNDEAVKYIQMKNFYLNGTLEIKYPGEKIGLGPEYLVPNQLLFVQKGDKLYCVFPPLFSYLSSLFYPLFGDRVIFFLPLLAFFLSLLLFAVILKRLLADKFLYYLLIFTFLLGTPMLIYAQAFWEFMPAVLCVTCSLFFLVRYFHEKPSGVFLFLSALLLGCGSFFRTEVIILYACYAVSLGCHLAFEKKFRDLGILSAGMAIPLVALAITNLINYQDVFGLHISFNWSIHQYPVVQTLLSAAALVGLAAFFCICRRSAMSRDQREQIYAFAVLLWLGFVLYLYGQTAFVSLALKFPVSLFIFFGMAGRLEGIGDRHSAFGNVLAGTVVLFIWGGSYILGDFHPGVRFALVIIPAVLVFVASEHKKIFVAAPVYVIFIAFVLYSTTVVFLNMKTDWTYKAFNQKRVEFLAENTAAGDAIIFVSKPYIHHAGPLFFDRIFIGMKYRGCGGSCAEVEDLATIFTTLEERGLKHCYYFTHDPDFLMGEGKYRTTKMTFSVENVGRLYLYKVFL